MEWLQVVSIIGTSVGCCWYFRRETKEQLQSYKQDSDAKFDKVSEEMKEFREETKEFRSELKFFHGRLCSLEEKYTQMMQRYLEGKGK
jgi:chromosome segregation ATPase